MDPTRVRALLTACLKAREVRDPFSTPDRSVLVLQFSDSDSAAFTTPVYDQFFDCVTTLEKDSGGKLARSTVIEALKA